MKGNEMVVLLGFRANRLGQQALAAHSQREREKRGKGVKRERVPWVFECEGRGTLKILTHPFNFVYLLIYLFIYLDFSFCKAQLRNSHLCALTF